jgi:hypothetical protein
VVCCENETVEVPGPQGASGNNGSNAFSEITDGFNMPGIGADTSSLLVTNSQWMTPNQVVYVENAGYMRVQSKADSTHVVLRNLGYTGNSAPATPIAGGQDVSPGGLSGTNGAAGSNGTNGSDGINAFTATTANFTQPAELATVVISVGDSSWVSIGQVLYVEGGGYYEVTAAAVGTITIRNLEDTSTGAYPDNTAPATLITSPKDVSPAGIQGPVQNTFNKVVGLTYQPAAGNAGPAMVFGAWTTFPLDTLDDPDGIASLAANQFTLDEGRYSVTGFVPIFSARVRLRIQDVTTPGTYLTSINCVANSNNTASLVGAMDIPPGKTFELQYYAIDIAGGTFGGSTGVPTIDEAYATLLFTRLEQ